MKRFCYIGLFILLGLLISLLLHGLIEIYILNRIVNNFDVFEGGFIWQNWPLIHRAGSLTLTVMGVVGGWAVGRHFWEVLYVEKRYGNPRW